jgi:hypothetical protein
MWQNDASRHDVNNDGFVTPRDALIVINTLNELGSRQLPVVSAEFQPSPFYDVNGDGFVTANDMLQVVNELNRVLTGEGEAMRHPSMSLERDVTSDNGSYAHIVRTISQDQLNRNDVSMLPALANSVSDRHGSVHAGRDPLRLADEMPDLRNPRSLQPLLRSVFEETDLLLDEPLIDLLAQDHPGISS